MARSAKKRSVNQKSPSPSRSTHSSPDRDRPAGPLSVVTAPDEREEVKVNNANVTELKNACDDALKRVRFGPCLFLFFYIDITRAVSVKTSAFHTNKPPH